jgi:hypothetical protein
MTPDQINTALYLGGAILAVLVAIFLVLAVKS